MQHVPPTVHEWPHLKGVDANEAKNFIEDHHRTLNVLLVPEGSATTKDFRPDRVRIFYDKDSNLVVTVPQIG